MRLSWKNGSFLAIFALIACGGEVVPAGGAGDAGEAGPGGDSGATVVESDGGEVLPAAMVGGFIASGSAQYYSGDSACMELDGDVSFGQEGDSRVVHADWLVLDVDDRDHDGDSQELMVRRTRLETSQSACP